MFFLGVLFGVGGVFLLAYLSAKSKEKKAQKTPVGQAESEIVETIEESGMNEDKGVENNG